MARLTVAREHSSFSSNVLRDTGWRELRKIRWSP